MDGGAVAHPPRQQSTNNVCFETNPQRVDRTSEMGVFYSNCINPQKPDETVMFFNEASQLRASSQFGGAQQQCETAASTNSYTSGDYRTLGRGMARGYGDANVDTGLHSRTAASEPFETWGFRELPRGRAKSKDRCSVPPYRGQTDSDSNFQMWLNTMENLSFEHPTYRRTDPVQGKHYFIFKKVHKT